MRRPTRLHEREYERQIIHKLLSDVAEGTSGAVLIEGAYGTGKTELLATARHLAAELGVAGPPTGAVLSPSDGTVGDAWVDALGPHQPLLLLMDDVHAGGPLLVRTVHRRLQLLAERPVGLVLTRTPGLGPPELDRLLAAHHHRLEQIVLDSLSEDAVQALLATLVGGRPSARLLELARAAGGNPRLVVDLVEGLREEGLLDDDDNHRLPARVRRTVGQMLAGMTLEAQQLARVGAMIGHSFLLSQVAAVIRSSSASLLAPLNEVIGAGLLRYEEEHLAFRSRLTRTALLDGIPGPVHTALSREIDEVLSGPHQEGIATAGAGAAKVRPAATVEAVHNLVAAGYVREAVELGRTVLGTPLEPGLAAEIRTVLAHLLIFSGQVRDGLAEAEAALATPQLSTGTAASAEASRLLALYCLDPERAHSAVSARPGDDRPLRGSAGAMTSAIRSDAAWESGDLAAGLRLGRMAAQLTQGPMVWPRLSLATKLPEIGEFEDAEAVLDAADALVARHHATVLLTPCATARALARLRSGRLDESERYAAEAVSTGERINSRLLVPLARSVLARLALLSGDLRAAERHVRRYREELAAEPGHPDSPQYDFTELLLVAARDGLDCAGKLLGGPMAGLLRRVRLIVQEPAAPAWFVRAAQAAGDPQMAALAVAAAESLAAANPDFPTVATAALHARSVQSGTLAGAAHAAVEHRDQWARDLAREDLQLLVTRLEQARQRDAGRADRMPARLASLTATELRVARLVAEGLTNRQAAGRLRVTPHTINYHLRGIYRKLDLGSRLELVALRSQLPG